MRSYYHIQCLLKLTKEELRKEAEKLLKQFEREQKNYKKMLNLKRQFNELKIKFRTRVNEVPQKAVSIETYVAKGLPPSITKNEMAIRELQKTIDAINKEIDNLEQRIIVLRNEIEQTKGIRHYFISFRNNRKISRLKFRIKRLIEQKNGCEMEILLKAAISESLLREAINALKTEIISIKHEMDDLNVRITLIREKIKKIQILLTEISKNQQKQQVADVKKYLRKWRLPKEMKL